jgi:hypothetical protein
MSEVTNVDVFRLAYTVKKLFDIFDCKKFGCKIAFETYFCNFDPRSVSDPIPQFLLMHTMYLVEMRILSYQAS